MATILADRTIGAGSSGPDQAIPHPPGSLPPATTAAPPPRPAGLADWVTHRVEACRGGRTLHTLVNHRDARAFELGDDDLEPDGTIVRDVADELGRQGFLAEPPGGDDRTPEPKRVRGKLARFAATLDISWPGADRLVRWLHRRGLRAAFHPVAVTAQVLLAVLGVIATVAVLSSPPPIELRVPAHLVPVFIGIGLAAVAVHELAHALVISHYGRSVDSVGFRLHLASPSFYVESVDALVLTRRQRILQAAAGPWAEWLFTSALALVLWLVPLPGPVAPVLGRFVALNLVTIASNLLPFASLDGSLILSDVLRVPDLARRSRGSVGRVVQSLAAGRRPNRSDAALAAYATTNAAVGAALFALAMFLWFETFAGLIGRLWHGGPLGVVTLAAAAVVLLRPALVAVGPQALDGIDTLCRLAHDLRFRRSLAWRIAAMEHLRSSDPTFAEMGAEALGLCAGRLQRVGRRRPVDASSQRVVHLPPMPGAWRGVVATLDLAGFDRGAAAAAA